MNLSPGTCLGPYEIVAPIGAGGMGEVYRARDTRLGREVAIKVLPSSFSQDADRLRRFEQEARAASALNHPGIVTLHDVGAHDGTPYVVTELLEGETLRSRLASTGALSPRKATDYGIQIANGLAAAHEKSIVHRDLKPENLFITEDGRVKILDFGLAKLIQPETAAQQQTAVPTASAGTEPGVVMGTVGYMSPEQVKGQAADHRSDIFSFGAILYEMLSGRRAFRGDSAVETMSAILKEEPPDLSETNKSLTPGLDRLVRHCLEKAPAQRFQSARDLAYDLESLSGLSGAAPNAIAPRASRRGLLATAGLVLLAGVLGWYLHARFHPLVSPTYNQITYRRGVIYGARFAPDAETIVYAAAWNGQPVRVFSTRIGSTESRDLGLPQADLLDVSRSGELAICLGRNSIFASGTLARVPLAGGAPREISSNVFQADWAPDGQDLAIIRRLPDRSVIEYPVGKVLYETPKSLFCVRFSPKGNLLAYAEQSAAYDSEIGVLDLTGKKRVLAKGFFSRYVAWRPSGDEIWFDNADRRGFTTSIFGVTLSGRQRLVRRDANMLNTMDIAHDGRALVVSLTLSSSMAAILSGETAERNVSWLDYSAVDDVSADGRTILFDEWGEGSGRNGAYYLWRLTEPAAIRLGEGLGQALSPDGKWALVCPFAANELILQPTGSGQPRSLGKHGLEFSSAVFEPDGTGVVSIAREHGKGWRLYRQDLEGAPPKAFSEEGLNGGRLAPSPDGRFAAALGRDNKMCIYPLLGDPPRCFDAAPADEPLGWSADGRSLFVCPINDLPGRIDRLDVASGRRELWKNFGPSDLSGVQRFERVAMTPGGASLVYSTERVYCTLFVIDGLR